MENWCAILTASAEVSGLGKAALVMLGILAVLLLVLALTWLILKAKGFKDELDYLNMEVNRTEGEERRRWIRRRRRLWLSLIPFVKKRK